ncbi:Replication-associated protein [Smittium mucronatum]|uniref:Replication-associated protein n=1 Tax=Smittium mucronatum TaxID=133383 RepID=A0A1R0GR68_9FUNG|nr:Replication-associated protein [Smittium mucronatum]
MVYVMKNICSSAVMFSIPDPSVSAALHAKIVDFFAPVPTSVSVFKPVFVSATLSEFAYDKFSVTNVTASYYQTAPKNLAPVPTVTSFETPICPSSYSLHCQPFSASIRPVINFPSNAPSTSPSPSPIHCPSSASYSFVFESPGSENLSSLPPSPSPAAIATQTRFVPYVIRPQRNSAPTPTLYAQLPVIDSDEAEHIYIQPRTRGNTVAPPVLPVPSLSTHGAVCLLTKQEVYDERLKKPFTISKYIIAMEVSGAGNPHIHVYLKTGSKLNIKNARYFDIRGYHGDYRSCLSLKKIACYVTKGGNFITNMLEAEYISDVANAVKQVIEAEGFEEAMEVIMNDYNLGRDWLRNPMAYEQGIRYIKRRGTKIYRNPNYKFVDLPILSSWDPLKYSLWLFGGAGLGKIEFAKTLFKNPLLVKHIEQLKGLHSDHDGIIFDDTKFDRQSWTRNDQLLLTDIENTNAFGVKYGSVTIPRNTGRIFISNNKIFLQYPEIIKRLFIVRMKDDLKIIEPGKYVEDTTGAKYA